MMFTIRKTLPFDEAMSSLIKGFEAMVPAILILTLAWTLKSMTDSLGAAEYVSSVVASSASELQMLLPGIIFLVAGFLAFATGTSWGTFEYSDSSSASPYSQVLILCASSLSRHVWLERYVATISLLSAIPPSWRVRERNASMCIMYHHSCLTPWL